MKRNRISLRIHPAGVAVLAASLLFCNSRDVISAVLALLLHEGAHLLAMLLCGMRECSIELTPFGGMADVREFDSYSAWKRIVSSAAGIAASAIAAAACVRFAPRTFFWYSFFRANTSLALLNSLPAWPLDGARVFASLASCVGWERRAKRLLVLTTQLLGVGLTAAGLVGVWHGMINPSLLVCGPYLCYAARAENVSNKVRHLQRIETRLSNSGVMPVALWAGVADTAPDQFSVLLGRSQSKDYQLLLAVDPSSGHIQKCWTEREMLNHVLQNGSN